MLKVTRDLKEGLTSILMNISILMMLEVPQLKTALTESIIDFKNL